MPVIVEMPAALRQFAGDQDTLNSSGKTVEEVFSELCSTHPELKKNLYGSDGKIRSFINIYINDEDIRYLSKNDTPVNNTDLISIVPAIAGGTE